MLTIKRDNKDYVIDVLSINKLKGPELSLREISNCYREKNANDQLSEYLRCSSKFFQIILPHHAHRV